MPVRRARLPELGAPRHTTLGTPPSAHHPRHTTLGTPPPRARPAIAASQSYINKEHIIGRAKGYLPYIGMVTIIMNDYPIVKYILVGLMGLFVLTTKE